MAKTFRGHAVAFAFSLCLAATVASAQTALVPPAVEQVAKSTITASALEAPIRYLADDLLEGRGPATRGDMLSRLYLATQLRGLGYEPGGPNGSYQQPFDIVGTNAQMPENWTFQTKNQSVDFKWSTDYIAGSGVQSEHGEIKDAELVFVGYGIEAPEYKWNDYKGMNLKGKVFVMLNNDPDWDPKIFEGKRRLYYGRWVYKYESAARQGAAGVIIIHTTPSAGYPWQVVQSSWGGTQFELPAEGEPRIQLRGWATEEAARRLLKAAGQDLDKLVTAAHSRNFKPVALGIRTSIAFDNKVSRTQTANVAGLLRGSDPKLASEVVIYSAHHDHFGVASAKQDDTVQGTDRIYNGAEDNASGCAQVLTVARAIAALPERPRRSTLILFVAGGGAGPARLAVLRAASDLRARQDRGEHQHRRRQFLRPRARHCADWFWQVFARCRRCVRHPVAGTHGDAGSISGSRLLLSLGSVQLREDRRTGALFQQGHRLRRPPRGLGSREDRGMGTEDLSPAERSDRRHLELRRDDRRHADDVLHRLARQPGRCDARVECGR